MQIERVVNAFLKTVAQDRVHGVTRSLAEYQALWSGHEGLIATKYREIFDKPRSPSDSPTEVGAAAERSATQNIGCYRVVRPIGRGGQGEVFLAADTRIERVVALKVFDLLLGFSPSARERFRREAELAARFDHPNLGTVFEAGQDGRTAFIASAYYAGGSLSADLEKRRRDEPGLTVPKSPTERDAFLSAFESLARGLEHAHGRGVLHRDIKPSNVVLKADGTPVLIDFGLARVVDDDVEETSLTATGDLFGTTPYLAPELLAHTSRPSVRTDVFGFGAMLFEAATGRRAFIGPTQKAVIDAVTTEEPPRASSLNSTFSRDFDAIVEAAIAKDPAKRYGSAGLLAYDLCALREGRPVSVARIGAIGRALRFAARRPVLSCALLAAILFLGAALVFFGLWLGDRPFVRQAERQRHKDAHDRLIEEATVRLHVRPIEDTSAILAGALAEDPQSIEARVLLETQSIARTGIASPETAAYLSSQGLDSLAILLSALADIERKNFDDARRKIESPAKLENALQHYLAAVCLLRIAHRVDRRSTAIDVARSEIAALDHLDIAVATTPTARRVYHLERLHAALHVGDRMRLDRVLAASESMCKETVVGRLLLANARADFGDPALARPLYENLLDELRDSRDAGADLRVDLFANYLTLLRRLDDRKALFEAADRFERTFPNRAEGKVSKLYLAGKNGDHDAFDRLFSEFLALPESAGRDARTEASCRRFAVDAALGRGNVDDAKSQLRKVIELDPSDDESHYRLGFYSFETDRAFAESCTRRAIEIDPDRGEYWSFLGRATTDPKAAEEAFRHALGLLGVKNYVGHELGARLEARGLFDEALPLFEKSIAAGFEPARGRLAFLLVEIGEIAAVAALADRGLKDHPTDPYPTFARAVADFETGAFEEAVEGAERTIAFAKAARRPLPDGIDRFLSLTKAALRAAEEPEFFRNHPAIAAVVTARGQEKGDTLAQWRHALESDARVAVESRISAAIDILAAHQTDADNERRSKAFNFARGLIEVHVTSLSWDVDGEKISPVTAIRELRRLLRHRVLTVARAPKSLKSLPNPENLSWRLLFDTISAKISDLESY